MILRAGGFIQKAHAAPWWNIHEPAFVETFAAPCLERGLFVVDRDRITCAGGLASLDLATTLIA